MPHLHKVMARPYLLQMLGCCRLIPPMSVCHFCLSTQFVFHKMCLGLAPTHTYTPTRMHVRTRAHTHKYMHIEDLEELDRNHKGEEEGS
jgi:hypothetical protein